MATALIVASPSDSVQGQQQDYIKANMPAQIYSCGMVGAAYSKRKGASAYRRMWLTCSMTVMLQTEVE